MIKYNMLKKYDNPNTIIISINTSISSVLKKKWKDRNNIIMEKKLHSYIYRIHTRVAVQRRWSELNANTWKNPGH